MYCKISSSTLYGLEVVPVAVETDISDGLPMMELVGYLGSEVKEARERVRTALKNSGFLLPARRITVNISPAGIRKQGTAFDFPIALSMMVCMGLVEASVLEGVFVMGELSLSGDILGITGVLPRVLTAREMGFVKCLVPAANTAEAAVVDGIDVIGVSSLTQVCSYLKGELPIQPSHTDLKEILRRENRNAEYDLSEIRGQPMVKRCLEIAAAGGHNLLLIGPPGAGKTMAAKRLPGIMPPLSTEESLELTKIYSIAGCLPPSGIVTRRPFVSPHHTSTPQALAGGGSIPRPGAISLAHKAVLFLDELPEFKKDALEILRQPMEEKRVNIARASATFSFPADFLLIAAMNPCKCGYYPDRRRCRCTEGDIKAYLSRISGPLLDRIDLCLETPEVDYDLLSTAAVETDQQESSARILERVLAARSIQEQRFEREDITINSQMSASQIPRYCRLGKKEDALLRDAFTRLGLSARVYHRILKVSRTIADLDRSGNITCSHLREALSYRLFDKGGAGGGII